MATIWQIRGMLLEEAMLYLLRVSGYRTVEQVGSDPTLHLGKAGLEVIGRGEVHQIDAIADSTVVHPFSYPQRLLLEAKFHDSKPVGLEIARNAVGVLKDVGEYWVGSAHNATTGYVSKSRYHYQYAIFSVSGFSAPTQRYAFAQDVYLIELNRVPGIYNVISAIRGIKHTHFGAGAWHAIDIDLSKLRQEVREHLKSYSAPEENWTEITLRDGIEAFSQFIKSCHEMGGVLLGVIGRRFPVLLVPDSSTDFYDLRGFERANIFWDRFRGGWILEVPERSVNRRQRFTFNFPPILFELYARQGIFSYESELEAEATSEIQITLALDGGENRSIRLRLDPRWLDRVRETVLQIIEREYSEDFEDQQ